MNRLQKFVDGTEDDWNYVLPTELHDSGLDKYFIVDVRKSEDFKEGHIKGSVNIFWLDMLKEENLKKLPKNKKILLVCYVGHTSSQMMVVLKLLGYDVGSLKFGMGKSPVEGVPVAGWFDYGYGVER
jgi:rhodanese-related sulfurtransferase